MELYKIENITNSILTIVADESVEVLVMEPYVSENVNLSIANKISIIERFGEYLETADAIYVESDKFLIHSVVTALVYITIYKSNGIKSSDAVACLQHKSFGVRGNSVINELPDIYYDYIIGYIVDGYRYIDGEDVVTRTKTPLEFMFKIIDIMFK